MTNIPHDDASLWARIGRRDVVAGIIATPSPHTVDLLASSGFDFIFLDNEHGLTSPGELRECIRAAAVHRVPSIVRVSDPSQAEIGKTLDAGAVGIVVAHVEDADKLAAIVACTRYAPTGTRGKGPTPSWLAHFQGAAPSSWNPGVIAIVESRRGVDAIDELVKVPGVDAIFPGPGDLSQELGVGFDDPKLLDLISCVNQAVLTREPGPALMAYGGTGGGYARRAVETGASILLLGPDELFLGQACRAALVDVRDAGVSHRAAS